MNLQRNVPESKQWHGSPYDRGSADSYYGRAAEPHYWPEGTYQGDRVEESAMSTAQVDEYFIGFDLNEFSQNRKEW